MTTATLTANHAVAFLDADRWRDPLQQSIYADWLADHGHHREAALRRVLLDPARDDYRLAYADVVAAEGEGERAEFIRVQVELARADDSWKPPAGQTPSNARDALRRRERELLRQHAVEWLTPSPFGFGAHFQAHDQIGWAVRPGPVRLGETYAPVTLRRGFVAELYCTAADFLRHAAAIFQAQPVERVTLTDREPFDNGVEFSWLGVFGDRIPDPPFAIPVKIVRHLSPREGTLATLFPDGNGRRDYPTADAARLDLSAACVRFGRAAARLPPWPG